ncbi:hypothetical protein QTP86_012462 [Hemibagrus guttatus]|nr:hypothetical protein QTP86_012462 [Hemibagrus guttatus]
MVLDWKKVACTLQVGGEFLPQVEEFKYLGVLFTSKGRMDCEIDRRIGAAAAVMRSMYRLVVVKKELSQKAKLSIYQSIYVPTLTYGHELWVVSLERCSGHAPPGRECLGIPPEELEELSRERERKADDVQYLDEVEDDEFNMNSVIHLIKTSPGPESPTPPPPVTPPSRNPSAEKPRYTLKPLKLLPPIKTTPPPTPPIPAPSSPTHTPTPTLPDFLNQFLQEEWFHSMYPEPGCIPESLSLTEFCAQLLDFLKRCVMDQKLCVLKAIITLYTHNSLNNTHTITHTITHSLLDSLHTCLHKDMSDMEQRFVVELLNFLVCVNPHSYDVTVEILLLLADRELRLQGVAVCMLQALGADDAQQWLRPQLGSWEHEAQKHTMRLGRVRELAHHWLNSWTAKYKIYKSAGKKSALFSQVISPSEVLRYFCWIQKEVQVKPPTEAAGRKDTVLLDTHTYRHSTPVLKLVKTWPEGAISALKDALNIFYAWFEARSDVTARKTIPPPEDQLADVFTDILNISLSSAILPMCLKTTIIISVLKKSPVSCLNDYRPVALTPIIMKCFERLVMRHIKNLLPPSLDPLQFAYRPYHFTDNAISTTLHLALTHLDNRHLRANAVHRVCWASTPPSATGCWTF